MKRIVLLLALAATHTEGFAQLNIAALQDRHNTANAARHLPTYLGDRFQSVQITLLNPYVSIGSNFATVADSKKFLTTDNIGQQTIGNVVDKLRNDDNNVNASVDLAIINLAFNIKTANKRKALSIGLGVNERVEMNTILNRETLLLAYNGNKQYADKTIAIAPRFNGVAFTEYYVSAAYNIQARYSDMVIKPAIRLSYLSGQASVEMARRNAITMYTEPQGRYLDFGLDYTINTSIGADSVKLSGSSFNVNNKSFQNGSGSGFGMDLGIRISPQPGLLLNVGVMDVGSIKFKNNVTNIYNHSTYRYEGQEITFTEDESLNLDSLTDFLKPNYSYNAYSMRLPTKLVLAGSISRGKVQKGKETYYKHQYCLTYLQGFANYLSSTTNPYLAIGYTRSFNDVLNLGANAGVGGVWGGHIGLLASVKAGSFRFGLSTNNVLPLIAPKAGRGTDVAMLLGLAF